MIERVTGQSWGRYPPAKQKLVYLYDRNEVLPEFKGFSLPHGNGRSYGDSNLNNDGCLLIARTLNKFISFDSVNGVLVCEAGVTLSEIIDICLPQGWFLPVTPGTRYVTVGGAIANDVHGKNHHLMGTFGHHVRSLELLRSDGIRQLLHPGDALFSATVGGLGLTGVITKAELKLRRMNNPWLDTESIRFDSLNDFFSISSESESGFEYTVAWVDCLATKNSLGRGVFFRGNHVNGGVEGIKPSTVLRKSIPFEMPLSLVNSVTLRFFNTLYYWRHARREKRDLSFYQTFFYPLDEIAHWNRIYGPKGFLQHQCVLPTTTARDAIAELLRVISRSGNGSFLAVLKNFGHKPAAGMLSFPREGTTLALDFRNSGASLFKLLDCLDSIVEDAGGAVYPAKDAHMSGTLFKSGYPRWCEFSKYIDPHFSSDFWRRVMD